jgi:cytochrome c6
MEAIVTQVTNGKNAMPAFKGRLNKKQIEDVASYVMEKAEKGW